MRPAASCEGDAPQPQECRSHKVEREDPSSADMSRSRTSAARLPNA